jgi:hypothetical protein
MNTNTLRAASRTTILAIDLGKYKSVACASFVNLHATCSGPRRVASSVASPRQNPQTRYNATTAWPAWVDQSRFAGDVNRIWGAGKVTQQGETASKSKNNLNV